MNVGEACTRSVVYMGEKESALEAARLMRRFHVGDVVIVRQNNGARLPVGIVTDRDLALEILALEVDPGTVAVGDMVTTTPLVTAHEAEDLDTVLDRMRDHGVRRLPIVDSTGLLVGILSADDTLELLTEGLNDLVQLVTHQRRREEHVR